MKHKYYESIGEKVYSEKLSNGLTVFVVPRPGFSNKYAFFATNYGGADRRFSLGGEWFDTPEGIAHFLEHKMFDTKNGNALSMLSANGASPNAYTSTDMTAYHFECIDNFYENLKILLSFVSVPYFTEESVEKEQGIIGQEIRMTDDQPGYTGYFNLMKCLYAHHPLRDSVAGTVDSIAQITAQTLYDCHKVFYAPSNMVLCVVGDVDPDMVMEIAVNTLPKEAAEIPKSDYGKEEAPASVTKYKTVSMDVGTPLFMLGFKCGRSEKGSKYLKQSMTAALALGLLAGRSSSLYSRLYSEGLITRGFGIDCETAAGESYCVFSDECSSPEKVASAILEEAVKIAKIGPDKELFERRKKAFKGGILRSLNSFENICAEIASAYFSGADAFLKSEILDTITINDITDFIKNNIVEEKSALSVIMPIDQNIGV